jgi:betaine-aldehyde dehydrogenase
VVLLAGQGSERDPREVFGPVVAVQPPSDVEETVAWASGSATGWRPRSEPVTWAGRSRVSHRLHLGPLSVNTHILLVNELPYSVKQSGYGTDVSMYSIEE